MLPLVTRWSTTTHTHTPEKAGRLHSRRTTSTGHSPNENPGPRALCTPSPAALRAGWRGAGFAAVVLVLDIAPRTLAPPSHSRALPRGLGGLSARCAPRSSSLRARGCGRESVFRASAVKCVALGIATRGMHGLAVIWFECRPRVPVMPSRFAGAHGLDHGWENAGRHAHFAQQHPQLNNNGRSTVSVPGGGGGPPGLLKSMLPQN